MGLRAILIKKLTTCIIQSQSFQIRQERGRFPSQTLPNPKGVHEVGSSSNSGMDEVKAIITLRSGKEVDQPMPKPVEETRKGEEMEPEHIFLKEDSM